MTPAILGIHGTFTLERLTCNAGYVMILNVRSGVTATSYAQTSAKQEKVNSAKNPLTGVYRKSCTCQPVTRYISTNGFFVSKDGPGKRSEREPEPSQRVEEPTQ